jgi:hypothetical protein
VKEKRPKRPPPRGIERHAYHCPLPSSRPEGARPAASGYRRFPPRLPDQPIFYPVLNREYAEQIARDWNTKDERSGFVGYVLEFDVDAGYLAEFEVKKVGGSAHLEYWIPAESLEEFNRHIQGTIRVIGKYICRSDKTPGESSSPARGM